MSVCWHGAVDEASDLRTRRAQVHGHRVALNSHRRPDGYHGAVKAIVVNKSLALVHAVGPAGDELADLTLGGGQHFRDTPLQALRAIAFQESVHTPGRNHHGADLRV